MSAEKPKITILLATFNRVHLIGETLDSILAQTYTSWECIIVDDHSSDSTAVVVNEYVQKDARFSYFLKTEKYKKGLSGTRNCGLEIAQKRDAKYIQFFDDDDIMHPKKMEVQVAPFLHNSSLDFTVCQYLGFNDLKEINFNNSDSDIPITSNNLPEDFLFSRVRINSAGPLFKAYFFKLEKFDEELPYGEEWELFNRIFFKYRPKYLPVKKALFYYRSHINSITAKTETKCEKIGAQIIILQKLWYFLKRNNLLKSSIVAFFLRQFLFQYYSKKEVLDIKEFLKNENNISLGQNVKFKIIISIHQFYLKLMKFLLLRHNNF